jgi:hypothetical protein
MMALLLMVSFAMAADGRSAEDAAVLSTWLEFDRRMTNGLSSSPHFTTREQAFRQDFGVLASFALIDYAQTTAMLYGSGGYHEINPLLGEHPSRGNLIVFGVIGSGLFYLIGRSLPDPWQQIFVDSVLSIERMNIEDNRRIHQGWNTDGPPIRGRSFNGIPIIISLRF